MEGKRFVVTFLYKCKHKQTRIWMICSFFCHFSAFKTKRLGTEKCQGTRNSCRSYVQNGHDVFSCQLQRTWQNKVSTNFVLIQNKTENKSFFCWYKFCFDTKWKRKQIIFLLFFKYFVVGWCKWLWYTTWPRVS